jgi:N-acetylmuramoyl-L-alanine amidase
VIAPVAIACVSVRGARSPPLVGVDAGHTSTSPGAVGARGTRERDLNVAVALKVASALTEVGLRSAVIGADRDLASPDRPREAERLHASALVSVHHDSVQPRYLQTWRYEGAEHAYSDRFRGFSLFVAGGPHLAESLALARGIADALLEAGFSPSLHHAEPIPGEARPLLDAPRGVHRYDELAILRLARMPAVLVECGVLVNRDEEAELKSPLRQRAFSVAVAAGIARWARSSPDVSFPRDGAGARSAP